MAKIMLLVLGLLAAPGLGAMTWQELQAEIDSVESGQPPNRDLIVRFSEIVQMLVTYNRAVQAADPQSQLFCPPPNGSFQLDEIVSMVRAQAREEAVAADSLVQAMLLDSFRSRFPCR